MVLSFLSAYISISTLFTSFISVAVQIEDIFHVSTFWVTLCYVCFTAVSVPFNFVANPIIDYKGSVYAVSFSALYTLLDLDRLRARRGWCLDASSSSSELLLDSGRLFCLCCGLLVHRKLHLQNILELVRTKPGKCALLF